VNVYPNPSSAGQSFTIKVTGNNFGYLRVVSIEGITLLVKEVRGETDLNIQSEPNWQAGTYFIQYLDKNKVPVGIARFVIK